MDFFALQCLREVAESGSFTRAASRLGRTQSAVSQQIAKLETFLQTPLFIRGKILSLTEEGEHYLFYARKILNLHEEAFGRSSKPPLVKGKVRFGVPEDFASVFLSDILADFSNMHPQIFLEVSCDLTLHLLDRFATGELDLVLVKMDRVEELPQSVEVSSQFLEWVSRPGLLDLSLPLPLVLSPYPCVYRKCCLDALTNHEREWRIVFSSPSYMGMTAAVKAGMGITVLPRNMIPKDLAIFRHRLLPPLARTHISLLKHTTQEKAILSFEDFVLQKLRLLS